MSSDSLDPAEIYFGTRSGELEENCRWITADLVPEGRGRPNGSGANNQTEFEIRNSETAENLGYEKSHA